MGITLRCAAPVLKSWNIFLQIVWVRCTIVKEIIQRGICRNAIKNEINYKEEYLFDFLEHACEWE